MKRVISRSFTFASMLAVGAGLSAFAQGAATPAATSAAATAASTKIAVINFQAAVMQTNEGQRNFAELRKKFEPKQAQLKTEADEIDALKKQLQTAGATLSDADRQTRLQAIDTKEKAYQRTGEDAQNDFQQEMAQTYQQLAEKVYGSLNTYATENGYGVVLDAAATQQQPPTVLWAGKGTDITLAVVQAYNAKSGVPAPAAVPSAPTPSHSTTPHAPSPK